MKPNHILIIVGVLLLVIFLLNYEKIFGKKKKPTSSMRFGGVIERVPPHKTFNKVGCYQGTSGCWCWTTGANGDKIFTQGTATDCA